MPIGHDRSTNRLLHKSGCRNRGIVSVAVSAEVVFSALLQTGYLTLQHDALSGRSGKAAGEKVHFTKSAFNAAVGSGSRVFFGERKERKRLEMADVTAGVVIEDDTGIEQSFGVEQAFHCLHHSKGFFSPFVAYKRCLVASWAVFGFL